MQTNKKNAPWPTPSLKVSVIFTDISALRFRLGMYMVPRVTFNMRIHNGYQATTGSGEIHLHLGWVWKLVLVPSKVATPQREREREGVSV